jgi:hypothetical protein
MTFGQRAHRKPVGLAEAGDGRSDRLDRLLQSSVAAFDAGLCQPDAIRAALARRSGKAGRMTDSAMGCEKQGQGQAAESGQRQGDSGGVSGGPEAALGRGSFRADYC